MGRPQRRYGDVCFPWGFISTLVLTFRLLLCVVLFRGWNNIFFCLRKGQSSDSSWPRMDFPSLLLHGPELQTSSKDCAVDTNPGLQGPSLGGRFSLVSPHSWLEQCYWWVSMPPTPGFSGSASKCKLAMFCLLQVLWGPQWLLSLGSGMFLVPVLCTRWRWVFGTCYDDACLYYRWILELICLVTDSSLWSVGENWASDTGSHHVSPPGTPSHSAKDTEQEGWGSELRSSWLHSRLFVDRAAPFLVSLNSLIPF